MSDEAARVPAVAPEKRVESLLHMVNEIDKLSLEGGGPLVLELRKVEWSGMWKKGQAVIEQFPELEEAIDKPNRGGRPKNGERAVSFRWVAEKLGRTEPTVIRWVKFYLSVGKEKANLDDYLLKAAIPARETWERKLVASDNERKEPEADTKKRTANQTFLQVSERVKAGTASSEDAAWLVAQIDILTKAIQKVQQHLLDGKVEKAVKAVEEALGALS